MHHCKGNPWNNSIPFKFLLLDKPHMGNVMTPTKMWGSQLHMGVSQNCGTPKSSSLKRFSLINHPFWGTPIFGNTHICIRFSGQIIAWHHLKFGECPPNLTPKNPSRHPYTSCSRWLYPTKKSKGVFVEWQAPWTPLKGQQLLPECFSCKLMQNHGKHMHMYAKIGLRSCVHFSLLVPGGGLTWAWPFEAVEVPQKSSCRVEMIVELVATWSHSSLCRTNPAHIRLITWLSKLPGACLNGDRSV